MIWSFSENRMFRKCQRQWFYKACCASAQSEDPVRREAYLLSKLQSVSAWRGQVVDDIVKTLLVPALNRGERPMLNAIALTRTKPHRDFPKVDGRWKATDTALFEVQLLRGVVRRHPAEDTDVQTADDRIAEGITATYEEEPVV